MVCGEISGKEKEREGEKGCETERSTSAELTALLLQTAQAFPSPPSTTPKLRAWFAAVSEPEFKLSRNCPRILGESTLDLNLNLKCSVQCSRQRSDNWWSLSKNGNGPVSLSLTVHR